MANEYRGEQGDGPRELSYDFYAAGWDKSGNHSPPDHIKLYHPGIDQLPQPEITEFFQALEIFLPEVKNKYDLFTGNELDPGDKTRKEILGYVIRMQRSDVPEEHEDYEEREYDLPLAELEENSKVVEIPTGSEWDVSVGAYDSAVHPDHNPILYDQTFSDSLLEPAKCLSVEKPDLGDSILDEYDHIVTDLLTADNIVVGALRSANWITSEGAEGSKIDLDAGTLELIGKDHSLTFVNGVLSIEGKIEADEGSIAGWDIGADSLSKNNTVLSSTGFLKLGTENDIVQLSAINATYRAWVGHDDPAQAKFSVTKAGLLYAEDADIAGAITAESGELQTLSVTGTITIAEGGSVVAGDATLDDTGVSGTGYSLSSEGVIATSGKIANWIMETNLLKSSESGRRIELDQDNQRVVVFDDFDNEKVVMGYLGGLPKQHEEGTWDSNAYGFWALDGDSVVIDGDVEFDSGDWIVYDDGSVKILDINELEIIRLGTHAGEKGLFLWDNSDPQNLLAQYTSSQILIGETGEGNQYFLYDGSNLDITARNVNIESLGGDFNLTGDNITLTGGDITLDGDTTIEGTFSVGDYLTVDEEGIIQITTLDAEIIDVENLFAQEATIANILKIGSDGKIEAGNTELSNEGLSMLEGEINLGGGTFVVTPEGEITVGKLVEEDITLSDLDDMNALLDTSITSGDVNVRVVDDISYVDGWSLEIYQTEDSSSGNGAVYHQANLSAENDLKFHVYASGLQVFDGSSFAGAYVTIDSDTVWERDDDTGGTWIEETIDVSEYEGSHEIGFRYESLNINTPSFVAYDNIRYTGLVPEGFLEITAEYAEYRGDLIGASGTFTSLEAVDGDIKIYEGAHGGVLEVFESTGTNKIAHLGNKRDLEGTADEEGGTLVLSDDDGHGRVALSMNEDFGFSYLMLNRGDHIAEGVTADNGVFIRAGSGSFGDRLYLRDSNSDDGIEISSELVSGINRLRIYRPGELGSAIELRSGTTGQLGVSKVIADLAEFDDGDFENDISAGNNINIGNNLRVSGSTVIDSSRDITCQNITASGDVEISGMLDLGYADFIAQLPTQDPKEVGQFWNDDGTVKVSDGG